MDSSLQLQARNIFHIELLDVLGVLDLPLIKSGLLMTPNKLIFCRLPKYKYPLKMAARSKLVGKTCLFTRNLQLFKWKNQKQYLFFMPSLTNCYHKYLQKNEKKVTQIKRNPKNFNLTTSKLVGLVRLW